MINPIVAACEEAVAVGHRVTGVWLRHESGRWAAHIRMGMVPADRERRVTPPPGVKIAEHLEAPADIVVQLPALTSEEQAEAYIAEVAKVGGAEDWARFERSGVVEYLTKPRKWGSL